MSATASLDAHATLTLDASGTVVAASGPLEEGIGKPVFDLLEPRCRERLRRGLRELASGQPLDGVFCLARDHVPVIVRGASADLLVLRALDDHDAAREIVGRIATVIFPEAGTTIRADRLLGEAAVALDLRLVAVAVPPADEGDAHGIELAAGPAVLHVDAISSVPGSPPWRRVLEERRPVEIPDLDAADPASAALAALGLAAFVGLPMPAPDGSTLGALFALADTARGWFPFEIEALGIVAEFLATDLHRRRAELGLERRATELAALLEATRDLVSLRDPNAILGDVVQRAIDLVPSAQAGSVYFEEVHPGKAGVLRAQAVRGLVNAEAALRVTLPRDNPFVARAFATGKAVLAATPDEVAAAVALPAESAAAFADATSGLPPLQGLLAAPLIAGDRAMGLIALASFDAKSSFGRRGAELLERFAGMAAAAIIQARLFDAVRMRSALVEAVRDGVLAIAADGTIEFANEGAQALFGRDSAAGRRGRLADLFDPVDGAALASSLDAVAKSGHAFGFLRARRADGTTFEAALALSRSPSAGCVGLVSDVTERRSLEARALQSQTLDSLGKLAAGIAHDFNNLLGALLGFASLARGKCAPDSPLLEDLGGIERMADQAAQLATRLLALGRTAPATRKRVDVNAIVNDLASVVRHSFGPTIAIDVRLAPQECWIEGDATALGQALLNLATNARDAMPNGGRLTLATAHVGDQVEVTVADDGIGMDPEVRKHLYEPFFTTKPQGKGTGLGCAIVFATVRAHGGAIDCETAPQQGTRFRLAFAAREREERPAPEPSAAEAPRGTGTVLLVEDESVLRRVTADMISALGYEVIAVPGGREAIEVARAQGSAIDVVLLDLTMPGMSGPECFAALRALDPSRRIVITTGFAAGDVADRLLERGALSLLPKPYRAAELGRALADAVRTPRAVAEREIV
ncbi:MAG TPA: ATP-binding protein [Planctomycetota bacterium]|nr:ATP-binding protein [Planctomycetota bacterium]